MKRNYIAMLAAGTVMFASCNDNAVFEKEMYKNEVALISTEYHNTFQEIVHMTGEEEITAYVATSVGGTYAPERDLVVGLVEDSEPLAQYNWAVYDSDESLYAKLVPEDRYDLLDDQIVIKAGERTGRATIRLRPVGLSPDSTYFIGLRATDISGDVEINPRKNTILYQVILQNDYATMERETIYTMTGTVGEMVTAANKQLFPLTHNSVRMVAGNEPFVSTASAIRNTGVILEVDEENNVTIKPYGDLQVTQLDNDPLYPNVFRVEEAFGQITNAFLLSYEYTIGGATKVMKERVELRVR